MPEVLADQVNERVDRSGSKAIRPKLKLYTRSSCALEDAAPDIPVL